ncbi:beta-propeller domain-containing protein [Actinomadura madurae]|uniref:beta-propeller domain-containing protein n=1 Tax=Actinomadura madurae TaxID=1993 RepID=UPI0020D20063|nr:beta-propeller domain-containing protein [Actinomadura madurae]MCQ0004846.1 beta-propeller domain-containing protein [Actinomadura madurae]
MRGRILVPAAAMLLLAGCSGSPEPPGRPAPASPVRLVAYDGCGKLLDELRKATVDRVGPTGLDGMPVLPADGTWALGKVPGGAESRAQGQAPPHSTTNSHEAGADEPDLVKTDGRRIIALADGRLRVIDPATRKVAHSLELPGETRYGNGQLLLSGDRVLVMSRQQRAIPVDRPGPGAGPLPVPEQLMRLTLVDVAGAPKIIGSMTSTADYLDARQSGSTVRVVVQSRPRIDFPGRGDADKATSENRNAVWAAPLEAWLPAFETDAGQTYRAPCDQVSRPSAYAGSSMLTMLTFDLSKGLGDPQPIAVTAEGSTVYGNGKSLYVTGTPPQPFTRSPQKRVQPRTDIYKFDVSGAGRPRYVASGSVKGSLLNQYSMSEHEGNLRIATTTSRPVPGDRSSQSSVYVLAQRNASLTEIGRVDGLGKGERIHSVRFIGAGAYVVTFRQTDPLYTLDLKDPRRPRLTGELKITGYSAYLHPTADGRLLGVGQDADTSGRTSGLQISLFDVSGEPRRVGARKLPGTSSRAEFDPHAFLYWPETGLTVVPVLRPGRGAAEALVLKVAGTRITETGTVRHPGRPSRNGVDRSLLVGGTLWTFSDGGAHATDASTLKGGDWLPYG